MTHLLQKAFDAASKLSPEEQDLLATWLLSEIASEDDFDRRIAQTSDRLTGLADEALAEFQAGETEDLDPDRL